MNQIGTFLLCLLAYVLLDWATFTPTMAPLGVTPWNPSIGLAVAVVILNGAAFLPLLFLGPLLSDILVRDLPLAWWVTVTEAALTALGYWFGVRLLMWLAPPFDPRLRRFRDLLRMGAVMIGAAVIVAMAYSLVLVGFGYLGRGRLIESALRYWVGDMIGLMVMTPFLLLVASRPTFPRLSLEIVLQVFLILGGVAIVVGVGMEPRMNLSFLLLLPVMWLAVRFGFEGVLPGLLLIQVCMMVALHISRNAASDVTMFQTIMVMLAVSGLAVGQLVSERMRNERRLLMQQDAIARAGRIGSMGAFATALAHELNQPLTAASNYARATSAALDHQSPRLSEARLTAGKLVEQVERSAQVVRRLRNLLQAGRIEAAPHSIAQVLADSVEIMRPEHEGSALIVTSVQPDLPPVAVDLVQIEQVMTNILRNAIEALSDSGIKDPQINVTASQSSPEYVEVVVSDNGPGFPDDLDLAADGPVETAKLDGLGIGLSLCRSIIAAHGGTLLLERQTRGACVTITLPISRGGADA
jgi:two-component system, LuxR family, sensor kinase FixL